MKNYPDGNVKTFWLLAQNVSGAAPSQSDAQAWHSDTGLNGNEHTFTLLDGAQDGFNALFPDRPGTDGSMVLTHGSIITAIDSSDPASAIADAL